MGSGTHRQESRRVGRDGRRLEGRPPISHGEYNPRICGCKMQKVEWVVLRAGVYEGVEKGRPMDLCLGAFDVFIRLS